MRPIGHAEPKLLHRLWVKILGKVSNRAEAREILMSGPSSSAEYCLLWFYIIGRKMLPAPLGRQSQPNTRDSRACVEEDGISL